jgi:hypothetical protein
LRIHGGFAFPFPYNACIGGSSGYTNVSSGYTQYRRQGSTLVLQGNARNQPFYQPYFNYHIRSLLSTKRAPTYLHNQPYLLAVVASALTEPSHSCSTLLGTVLPGVNFNPSTLQNRCLSFGVGDTSINGDKLRIDQGWMDYTYNVNIPALPSIYLVWRKSATSAPLVTVNGIPREVVAERLTSYNDYLRVLDNELVMLSMGGYGNDGWCRFSGSIYEAMVLTGPNIKYGHQRLIEGYLAWKWGLQHKLPRRHSYRRVPPAR